MSRHLISSPAGTRERPTGILAGPPHQETIDHATDRGPVLPPLPAQEYAQLRDSIRERGVLHPLLITSDHVLVDGHEQWKVIREFGMSKYLIRIIGNL